MRTVRDFGRTEAQLRRGETSDKRAVVGGRAATHGSPLGVANNRRHGCVRECEGTCGARQHRAGRRAQTIERRGRRVRQAEALCRCEFFLRL